MSFRPENSGASNIFSTQSKKKLQSKEDIESEFNKSGERKRLNELVEKRLKETGWASEVENLCRKYVTEHGIDNLKFEDMIEDVRDRARRMVPEEVKKELMENIRHFVDDHLGLNEK